MEHRWLRSLFWIVLSVGIWQPTVPAQACQRMRAWVSIQAIKPVSPPPSKPKVARALSSSLVKLAGELRQTLILADLYYRWGNNLHRQEKLTEAAQAYQQALILHPRDPAPLINQGLTWIELGKFDRAIANFKAILQQPDREVEPASLHTIAYYNLAIIYKRQGKVESARQSVQQALRLSPNFSKAKLLNEQLEPNSPDQKPK